MTIAIIQARMSSTRLPGKILKEIQDKPMLELLVERLRHCKKLDKIVIATSNNEKDAATAALAKKINCPYFVGSEDDVLDRFYQAAKKFQADVIVRITGDCPLHDPKLIDKVVNFYLENQDKYDYVSNVDPPTFPDGLDLWVFPFETLERAWKEAKVASEREHVCPYIWKNPDKFRIGHYESGTDYSYLRWTVDDQTDFDFVKNIYDRLYQNGKIFGMREILNLLEKDSELHKAQEDKIRDEGYLKSIFEDKILNKNIIIKGENIFLKKLTLEDASEEYCGWLNDPEVNKNLVTKKISSIQLEEYINGKNNSAKCLLLGIFDRINNKHIGNIKLEPIEFQEKKAVIGVLIGNKNYWGRGAATEAVKLAKEYAFGELNLSELSLGVFPDNKAAIKVYEKNGFKIDRVEEKSVMVNGQLFDNLIMVLKK